MKLCAKCDKQYTDDANFCPVCASKLAPLQAEAAGADVLSTRFALGARVGGARTGDVFDGNDNQTQNRVAIKMVGGAVLAAPGAAGRIEREAKQLEKLTAPGIAKIVASGKRGEVPWLAMEFVEGAQTLAVAIADRGPVGLADAAEIVEVIGEALVEAAQAGVVHRDLAPKNVLFAQDQFKLINFSLPVPTSDKSPGVPEFVAPEVVEGKPADQRSNIYSLGAIFYFALTGKPPFTGDVATVHQAHLTAPPAPPSTLVPVSAEVDALVLRALEKSPSRRFLTVRQFVDEALRIGKGVSPASVAAAAAGPKPRGPLVQTLMGMRAMPHGVAPAVAAQVATPQAAVMAAAPSPSPFAPPASAPVVAPVQAVASAPAPSPFAPPAAAAAPVAAAPVPVAAPVSAPASAPVAAPAAPVIAAPVVAAPVVAGAGGKAPAADEGKGKFRETMWFKKGDLDVAAAELAAKERAKGKDADKDKVDSLPIDDRYRDDGSITKSDKDKYSLRTGGTQMMSAVPEPQSSANMPAKVSEDALIGEMKGGRGKYLVAILVGVALVAGIIAMLVL